MGKKEASLIPLTPFFLKSRPSFVVSVFKSIIVSSTKRRKKFGKMSSKPPLMISPLSNNNNGNTTMMMESGNTSDLSSSQVCVTLGGVPQRRS